MSFVVGSIVIGWCRVEDRVGFCEAPFDLVPNDWHCCSLFLLGSQFWPKNYVHVYTFFKANKNLDSVKATR